MMVTAGGEMALLSMLSSHGDKVSKLSSYAAVTASLKDSDFVSQVIEELQLQSTEVVQILCKDILAETSEVALAALQVVGFCLHQENIAEVLAAGDQSKILDDLCTTVVKTTDKNICTRALWCLATQSLTPDCVSPKVDAILAAVEDAMCNKNFQSMTVEHEGLNVIIRLLEQTKPSMMPHTRRWAKLLYPLLVHGAAKVRDRAGVAMEIGMPAIMEHQMEVGRILMSDLKNKESLLLGQIGKLMSTRQEVYVMKVWCYYVQMLGKLLHHGTMINQLLPIVEQAFKNQDPEVKKAAYGAWRALIDNFALNPDIVSDTKRVKLVMQVFKLSNAKHESVAMAKLETWWFFVQKLGPKASAFFDMVCVPLLEYCVGGLTSGKASFPGSATRTPTMARLGISPKPGTPGGLNSPAQSYRCLARAGSHVLGRMLGSPMEDPNLPPVKFTIDELQHEIITGTSFFVKQAPVFLSSVRECLSYLGDDIPDGLLYHIWYALVAHVKNVLDTSNKKDAMEVLPAFLATLQHLVTAQCLQPEKLLKLLQAVVCLPAKALASSSYSVVTTQTGVMQGSPALFLLEILFNHRLLETCASEERFFILLEKLIECGLTNQRAVLGFCKSVLQLIDQSASKVEKKEMLWRMWSAVVQPLQATIQNTNEVNQGDILEHDFSCLHTALQLPIQHLLSQEFPQQSFKAMMKSWADLYATFARLAAMVTNAEANICCEELCARLLANVDNSRYKLEDVVFLDGMTQACQTIITQVDFSSLSSGAFGMAAAISPGKFLKKQKPLGNLNSYVRLFIVLMDALHKVASSGFFESKKLPSNTALQIPALTIIDILATVFTHLPSSGLICLAVEKLAKPVAMLYEGAAKKTSRMYSPQLVLQKLEKLWVDIVTCIQGRYQGHYDTEFLARVSPLFESTFLHQRRSIRNQTNILWNATFGQSPSLQYPDALRPILSAVKGKTSIVLPEWKEEENDNIEVSQVSQVSLGSESQVPLPNIVGLPSPRKTLGSFMNKVVSPEVKKSPLRPTRSPVAQTSARKKLIVEDMTSSDFVVITPSSKKKRVLTEHQKEVLRERSVLPTMYNNLDASQDRTMMSQLNNTTNTQSELSQSAGSFSAASKVVSTTTDGEDVGNDGDLKKGKVEMLKSKGRFSIGEPTESDTTNVVKKGKKASSRKSVSFFFENQDWQNDDKKSSPMDNLTVSKVKAVSECTLSTENDPIVIPDSETGLAESEKPLVLFGRAVPDLKVNGELTSTTGQGSGIPAVDIEVVPDTECQDSPKQLVQDSFEDGQREMELKGSQSEESEHILDEQHQKKETRQRRSRRSVQKETSSRPQIDPEEEEGEKNTRTRRRNSQGIKTTQQSESKKMAGEGSQKMDLWVVRSPRKGVVIQPPVILVEDSQQVSPRPEPDIPQNELDIMEVEETPLKEMSESWDVSSVAKQKTTKALFSSLNEKTKIEEEAVVIADSENPEGGSVQLPNVLPDSQSVNMKPFVQLERLTQEEIKQRSGSSSSEDITVTKVESGRTTPVVKKLRRRSSIRFSKASQEKTPVISPVDMDDIIPSTQDSFGFFVKDEMKQDVEDSVVVVSQSDESQDDMKDENVEMDGEKEASNVITKEDDKAFIVELKPSEPERKETVVTSSSSEPSVMDNPDISPVNLTSDSSPNSQATIIEQPAEQPEQGKKRPQRWRSVPKRFRGSEGELALLLSPSRANRTKSSQDTEVKTKESQDSEVKTEESQDSEVKTEETDDSSFNPRPDATLANQAPPSSQECEPCPQSDSVPQQETAIKKNRKKKVQNQKGARKKTNQDLPSSVNLNEVVNKKCNLDVETDSDDDIPINRYKTTKIKEKREVKSHSEEDDDIPLVKLVPKPKVQKFANRSVSPALPDRDEESKQNTEAQMSGDIFQDCELVTSQEKLKGKMEKSKTRKHSSMLKILQIDMKVSPVQKSHMRKSPLSRSLNLKRRNSPLGRRSHFRSKSVTPPTRRARSKVKYSGQVKEVTATEIKTDDEVGLVSKTGEDMPSTSQPESSNEKKETSQVKADTSPERKVLSPKSEIPSPRRSPRKLSYTESPQKSSLSPTRQSASKRMDIPETPTSATKHQSRAGLILERSRLFASRTSSGSLFTKKKITISRRKSETEKESVTSGILRIPGVSDSPDKGTSATNSVPVAAVPSSARSPTFRPVCIPRICSPSASPSAGILKKRKLSGEVPTDSPSPPNKQRRVSFAKEIDVCNLTESPTKGSRPRPVNRCLDMPAKSTLVMSPLVTTSKVTTNQDKFMTTTSKTEGAPAAAKDKEEEAFAVPRSVRRKEGDVLSGQATPNSCKSTQESQLNCQDPVFPDLVSCSQPIDQILPQLTSSTWVRGLGQLVRARNIHTVGNLCAMSENDVHSLPIRSPKVSTVRRVLQDYETQLNLKKARIAGAAATEGSTANTDASTDVDMECSTKEEVSKSLDSPRKYSALPRLEDEFEVSPIKDLDSSIESEGENLNLALRDEQPLITPGQSGPVHAPSILATSDVAPSSPLADSGPSAPDQITDDASVPDQVADGGSSVPPSMDQPMLEQVDDCPDTPVENSDSSDVYEFRDPLGSMYTLDTPAPLTVETQTSVESHLTAIQEANIKSNDNNSGCQDGLVNKSPLENVDCTDGRDDTDGKETEVRNKTETDSRDTSRKLLAEIRELARKLTPEVLSTCAPNHLMAIHLELHNMATNVILAQRKKCPLSPSQSQDSDEG